MNIAVLKFGGSSVADNEKLQIVTNKILEVRKKFKNIVVVVSAQGKTTDKLIGEAEELSKTPNKREFDSLISTGEQISASKIAILLEEKGISAISLTGWQAGIITSSSHSKAIIESINNSRITDELLKGKIVIVTGFQGIDKNYDITTLGRGGSDTSAVALAAALEADECDIFSDVEGIYSADPRKVINAKKLSQISYDEMLELSYEGAKVLHTRCVEIGKNFGVPIFAKSTFNDNVGTIINKKIEINNVKSIVKNDNIVLITFHSNKIIEILQLLFTNEITFNDLVNFNEISFTIDKKDLNLLLKIFKDNFEITYKNVSKISIIGEGISNSQKILKKMLKLFKADLSDIYKIDTNQTKIVCIFKELINDENLISLHQNLIEQ